MATKSNHEPEKKGSSKARTRPGAVDGHGERGAGVPLHPDKASFLELIGRIEAVPKERATPPHFTGVDAATVALRLADVAAQHQALFVALDQHLPGLLDALETLPKLGRAHRYMSSQLAMVQANEGQARVPEALIAECDELRTKMSRVLGYNLDHLPQVALELERLRLGSGHRDRADDLEAYASLYEEHAQALAQDKVRYDRGDAARARRISVQIGDHLDSGELGSAGEWARLRAKATPLIVDTYDRVVRAMLLIDHEASFDDYPRFTSAVRALQAARGAKRSVDDATPVDDERAPNAPEVPPPAAGGAAPPPS